MAENYVIGKILQDIINTTNSPLPDSEAERQLARIMGDFFGIDKVAINAPRPNGMQNNLYDYVSNTKKTYIDNQLSEYSSFPELISYKNRGYRSCAIVPVVISGKVVSIVEMLSCMENKFSAELIGSASLGANIAGLALLYRSENERSIKLAEYFTSAFNSPIPQLLVSQDGTIVRANDKAKADVFTTKNSGMKINEVLGLDFNQLIALSKKSVGGTVNLERNNQVLIYKVMVSQASEKLLHISLQDVTELNRFSLLMDSMDSESYAGAFYLDRQLNVKAATSSIKSIIGYDRNLIIGKGLIELIIEKQRGAMSELLGKQNSKEKIHGTMDLATITGIPAHLRFTLTKWPNGYVMLFSDATSEGYAESIRGAFTDFINGASDLVMTMDELGYVKDCNMSAESVLGYRKAEMLGKEARSLYSDQSIFERDITYVRSGSKVDNSYVMLVDRNGNKVDATHSIRLFRSPESADYIIVVKELETKRKLADFEDQLEDEKKRVSKLTATGKLKSQFIYNISHELKTPLTNIKGFSKLLYQGEWGELNRDELTALATIIDEGDRLMQIIQQVLDAAKLESEKMSLELREVNLKDIGENPTIQTLKENAVRKGLLFSWDVDYDVPAINADPNKLLQVFVNLINNATKFTNKGSIKVKVSRLGRTKVKCEVIDTGIGISDEDQHKLFKKFYEAPKKGLVKQEGAGTGLGLTIAQEIAKLHGGRIYCDSELGKGSRFSLVIKIKPKPRKDG